MEGFTQFFNNLDDIWKILATISTLILGVMTILQGVEAWESLKERRRKKRKLNNNSSTPPQSRQKLPNPKQKNWLSISVSCQHNQQVTFSQGTNNRQMITLEQLPEENSSDTHTIWQALTDTLFRFETIKQAYESNETIHLRIMTDDSKLGFLPWHCLPDPHKPSEKLVDNNWMIEVSPCSPDGYAGYNHKSIDNPLIVIPSDYQHDIIADRHFSLMQGYLESELDVQSYIPRVNTPNLLLSEIKRQQPDFIYIYARYKQGKIQLDADNTGKNTLSFDELAQGLQASGIRPIIIISLLSEQPQTDYPIQLITNTSLLWMLTATHIRKIYALEDQLFNTIEKFSKNPDITATIKKENLQQQRRLQSLVWNNQQTPQLEVVQGEQRRKRQFRAAVLKVVLGREELKDRISGGINRHLNQTEMLVYAISGTAVACPFDVPAQIRHHMEYNSAQQLPFISHHFNIQIAPDPQQNDMEDSIDNAISHSLLTGSGTIKDTFRKEIERRGLQQDCCIALNWYFRVPADMHDKLLDWVEHWDQALCAEFNNNVPENALLLHALCLQLETQEDVESTQKQVNKILGKTQKKKQPCNKEYLRLSSPLGALESNEINDFFDNNSLWRDSLQINQQNIDTADFADWIHQQTGGDFEKVVNIIWQQFQHNYQEYKHA